MRKWRNDFAKTQQSNFEQWYDMFDDWKLIESSIAQQYGIRVRKEIKNLTWGELSSYIEGINSDTPLGQIIAIRSENDREKLKSFTTEQKRIRNEYRSKMVKNKPISDEEFKKQLEGMKQAFIAMAGGTAKRK
ncbi:hypothetical protein IJD44_07920 [bacterium]|nr:hypothetical protein [bacterium]